MRLMNLNTNVCMGLRRHFGLRMYWKREKGIVALLKGIQPQRTPLDLSALHSSHGDSLRILANSRDVAACLPGHFLLTYLLLNLLEQSAPSRVITLTSVAHYYAAINTSDIHSNQRYSPSSAYAQSKLANVLFTRQLAKRMKGEGRTDYLRVDDAHATNPSIIATRPFATKTLYHFSNTLNGV